MCQDKNKYAIILITFNPCYDTLSYIDILANHNVAIFMVDNSPNNIDFTKLAKKSNIHLQINGKNIGLASALNAGINSAHNAGFTNIFLFDQDTRVDALYFPKMLAFKTLVAREDCIIYAPNFLDTNSNTYAKFINLTKWSWNTLSCKDNPTKDVLFVDFAITSGSLLDYNKYKENGIFREDYFIDHIDSEYCLRASTNNLKIAVNCEICIRHQIGQRTKHKFLGLTIKPNHHDASRRYYIARNGIRTILKYYRRYPSVVSLNFARLVHETISILLYEKHKINKIAALICGIFDGFIGRMGQYR